MTDHAMHSPSPKAMTGGLAAVAYGGVTYLLFLGTFLYAMAFVANLPVPKTIDSGQPEPLLPSLVINALLLGVFAIQHSVMARPAFKRWWTRLAAAVLAVAADARHRVVGDRSDASHDPPNGFMDRLGDRAGQHLHDQPFRAVRPAPGPGASGWP